MEGDIFIKMIFGHNNMLCMLNVVPPTYNPHPTRNLSPVGNIVEIKNWTFKSLYCFKPKPMGNIVEIKNWTLKNLYCFFRGL